MAEIITIKPHQALDLVKPYLPANPIIIEAGAFDGKDTAIMSALWPAAHIHAFEPVPEIFTRLQTNTQHLPNVWHYQIALSNKSGFSDMYISEKPEKPGITTQANSLLKPAARLAHSPIIFPFTTLVQTITLDDWATQHKIAQVDFLRLDLQGYELNVLMAATQLLKTVKVIITEVEFIQAYENQYQYPEVKKWLEENGFTMIAKDFPDNPSWFFGNAIFIRD